MKNTILFIIISLLLFVENTFSQEYHPMLNNSSWKIVKSVSCCIADEENIIQEGIDIEIGSRTYKQFIDPFPSNVYYNSTYNLQTLVNLREEIAERKVYKLVNGTELLLYDFNFEIGNTIHQYGNNFVVTAVNYIPVEGGTRKKITLRSEELYCGDNLTLVWIEGVGSDKTPFYPDHNMYNVCSSGGGIMVFTQCSFQNGEHIYGNPDCATFLNINQQNQIASNINFSPNPFTTTLNINSEIGFQDITLKMYNSIGQLVRENANLKGQNITIDRENLQSGLYLIQLFENNKLLKTNKVLIKD